MTGTRQIHAESASGEILDTEPRTLCDAAGRLNRDGLGWSRQPLHSCELHGPWLRQKKWDAWGIGSDRWFVLIGIMNLDYASLAIVNLYDLATERLVGASAKHVLGRHCAHAARPDVGTCSFEHRDIRAELISARSRTHLSIRCRDLAGQPFEADFEIERLPDQESLNLVIPWSNRHYHFTSKQACLPAFGSARYGTRTIEFPASQATAWLDFARGIWPYESGWKWAMCSARHEGRLLGFNLGSGWTDGTGVNENAIYVDGRLVKLGEDVRFHRDSTDPSAPWRIQTVGSDQVELVFTPLQERMERLNLLVIRGELKQFYGRFQGRVVDADGDALAIDDLFGVVEDHASRW